MRKFAALYFVRISIYATNSSTYFFFRFSTIHFIQGKTTACNASSGHRIPKMYPEWIYAKLMKLHLNYLRLMIDPQNDQLRVGLIAQLVEHCTSNAEVTVRVPFRPEFFRPFFRYCLSSITEKITSVRTL